MPYVHAQAPVRIGLAGGGTDLPAWTRERPGRCLSLAIASYTHAVAITRPDRQVVASYSHLDRAACATEIGNGLVRESALLHDFEDGFEVHTLSEVPSTGSGLGVSSSIAVSLAACFSRLAQLVRGDARDPAYCDGGEPKFRADAAQDAWTVEIDRLRRPIGRQDHMAAAWGGLRLYAFEGVSARVDETFTAEDAAWVADRLLLVKLPDGHDSRAILSGSFSTEVLQVSFDAVDVAVRAIRERSPVGIGKALLMGQWAKTKIPGAVPRGVAEIIYQIGKLPGVHGCKIAGAGGGGHLVVCRDPEVDVEICEVTGGFLQTVVKPDLRGVRSEACL